MKKDAVIGAVVGFGIVAGLVGWFVSADYTPPDHTSADWLGSQAVADSTPSPAPAYTPAASQVNLSGLMDQLHGPDDLQRTRAAQRLAELGPQAAGATGALMDAIKDGINDPVRHMNSETFAFDALNKIGPGAKDAIPDLINFLTSDNAHDAASDALVAIGSDSIPPLIAALDSDQVSPPPNLGGFAPRLDDGSRLWLRDQAAETLGKFGAAAAPAVPRLIQMLNSGNVLDEISSARALGNIGQAASDALPRLNELATTNSPFGLYHAANDAVHQIQGN